MIKGFERCETCALLNKESSNENWLVCAGMPLDVILAGTSKDCSKFEALEEKDAE